MIPIDPARARVRAFATALRRIPAWVDAVCVAALCIGVALLVFHVSPSQLRVPLLSVGDASASQYFIRTTLDHGWYLRNPDVGAPFGADMYDFAIPEPSHFLFVRLLGLIDHDVFGVYNLFYILSFGTVALSAWWALRLCGLSRPFSFAGAFLYAMLPYHFLRQPHLFLAAYFSVAILAAYALRLALYRAPHVRGELRLTVPAALLIAVCAGGGIYYAFFGCVFLAAGAAMGTIRSRNIAPLRTGVVCIAIVVGVVGLSLLPNTLHEIRHGRNALVAQRTPDQAERYGLKLTQLLLPTTYHRSGGMSAIARTYDAQAPLVNENTSASLGILGGIGLLLALAAAILPVREREQPLAAAGALCIVGVLFATIGGVGSLFAFLVTPSMRGLNRISPHIAFFALFSLLWLLQRLAQSQPRLTIAIAAAITLSGSFDEIPGQPISRADAATFDKRQAVFDRIEATLPPGTAVFELPYVFFPEDGRVSPVLSYALFEPYLRTSGLRWSFGGMRGRASDIWNEQAAALHGADLVSVLSGAGFGAIYIDRRGYKDRGAAVEKEITMTIGPSAIEDAAGNVVVYRIPPSFKKRPFVVFGRGRSWQPWMMSAQGAVTGLAAGPDPELIAANPGNAAAATVEFTLRSGRPRRLAIDYEGLPLGSYDLLPTVPKHIALTLTVAAGVSPLRLRTTNTTTNGTDDSLEIRNLEYRVMGEQPH
jgi:phosphoglycerol transferase